jgi:hypothetical protein
MVETLRKIMVTNEKYKYSVFCFPKSIFIFQKWTKINVQKSFFENNLGKTLKYALYNKWIKVLKEPSVKNLR